MDIVSYAFFAYGLTAVIALAVVGIIVLVSKLTNKGGTEEDDE